ncbi:MAG: hypothetical protein H7Y22_01460 [Gemmatimonadaceae bacterium]|nr:hypothetical protein [Gloeobacterales cyanobacterium ES-bin-141]
MSDDQFFNPLNWSSGSDAESSQVIREIAHAESRSVAQVAVAALKLYASLSGDVRNALRELEAFRHLVNQIARVVRSERFDSAAGRVAQSLPQNVSVPEDEDAILAMAVSAVDGTKDRP